MASFRPVPLATFLAAACLFWPAMLFALSSKAASSYMEGLDALNEGRWSDAATAFSRALEQSGDDPDIVLARGVTLTLAEEFPRALNDLRRIHKLGYQGREPELWLYVAEAMSGQVVVPDHALGAGPRGLPAGPIVVMLPGHLAQGLDDYSTEYGSFILYQLGQDYQNNRLPVDRGGTGRSGGTKSPQMRETLLKAGRLFAEKHYRRPELASISVARAKQASGGKATHGTMAHVVRALDASPGNADAHAQAGKAWLEAGRPVSARKAFTIALTLKPDLSDAYLDRATAAARMGDEPRMTADLKIYEHIGGWLSTRSTRSAVDNELRDHRVKGSPGSLFKDLQEAARSGQPMEQLVAVASKVHRTMGEQRLRYDEIYQDRLRILDDAVRNNPKNADKLVALATYLIEEADNRGEQVEPRRAIQPYRFQVSRELELKRAIQLVDQALTVNPQHAGALAQKAVALTGLGDFNQAEKVADQVLTVAADNPDALGLYARFRSMRANQMSNAAWNLRQERCTSSTSEHRRSDGITEVVETTTCIPPSQADLQRADQLDAAAADFRRRARAAMENAIRVTKGTVDGLLLQADLALWDGKTSDAQRYIEQAVKLDPQSLQAQDRLVQHYARSGQSEKAEEQRLIFTGLFHTTAAPLLRMAWRSIEKTAWQAAKGYLVRAARIDPEDARIPAYLGVINDGEGHAEEAAASYRVALALEDARLRLDEQRPETGAVLGRDALEFGLATQARFHLARALQRTGNQQEALAHYQAVLAYEKRMNPGFESREMFTALWPDRQPEGGALVVGPQNAATLIADAHLQTGKILSAMGKHDDALAHLRTAAMFGPLRTAGTPKIGDGQGKTNFGGQAGVPAKEAQILLAKELIEKGDAEGAQAVLFEAGTGVPEHLRKQINEINMAMLRLPPRPYHDPYADTPEEQTRLAELKARRDQQAHEQLDRTTERQAQREAERQRMMVRRTLSGSPPLTRVVPSLVGRWEMVPDQSSASKRILTIQPDSRYSLVTVTDGSTISGTAYLQNPQRGRRDKSEPSRGHIMLYDERSGQIGAMSYEFTDEHTLQLIGASGTRYLTRRLR